VNGSAVEAGAARYELIKPISRRSKGLIAVEILVAYVRARWLLWRRDLPTVLAVLRGDAPRSTGQRQQAVGIRLGRAVGRTLRFLPFDSRCLVRSLVLTGMLSRRGIDSVLVIGVGVEAGFTAHAWVESGGVPLLEPLADEHRLVEV
jgi:hypothetical protein